MFHVNKHATTIEKRCEEECAQGPWLRLKYQEIFLRMSLEDPEFSIA